TSASIHFLFGDGLWGLSPAGMLSKRLSKLRSAGGGAITAARDVVNPIQRPRKMMVIHMASDSAAVVLPARGAAGALSQRCIVRPEVSSKTSILMPESTSINI